MTLGHKSGSRDEANGQHLGLSARSLHLNVSNLKSMTVTFVLLPVMVLGADRVSMSTNDALW